MVLYFFNRFISTVYFKLLLLLDIDGNKVDPFSYYACYIREIIFLYLQFSLISQD